MSVVMTIGEFFYVQLGGFYITDKIIDRVCSKSIMGKGRREEIGDRRQPTPDPSQEGKTAEIGIIEEVGERIIKGLFCVTMSLKC